MIKRPILIACIGYIIGIILGLYFKSIALFFIGALIVLFLNVNKKVSRYLKILVPQKAIYILIFFIIFGFTHISILNKKYTDVYKINEIVEVTGIIEKIEYKEYSNKYIIRLKSLNGKRYTNAKLILYTKKENVKLECFDFIKLRANYSEPEDSRNYKGFSYKSYLKQNNIYGIIEQIEEIQVLENNKVNIISRFANNIKTTIIDEANNNLSKDASAIFSGILLGEKSEISDEINTYFREGNMAHILAVSGAHVSYIIFTVNIFLSKSTKKFYIIFTIALLIFFMILTGLTPSVIRACIMSIIALIAKIVHKKSDIYTNLSLSAIIILLSNPYTIFNIGFQLTYLGTLGIVLLSKKITFFTEGIFIKKENKYSKLKKSIINLILISISVQILIAPIILINFNTVSCNFLISGVVSTPVFSAIMVIGIVCLIVVPFRKICFPILEILIDSLIGISKFISNIPFLKFLLPTPSLVLIIVYYIILIAILFFKSEIMYRIFRNSKLISKVLKNIVAILVIICIITQVFQYLKSRDLKIYFIDVGQGDSTLIVTPKNKKILIDGGGSPNENYDIGKNIVVPYLLDRGIISIDYMMISHFDNDHCGGLKYVIKTIKVKNILISKQSKNSDEYTEIIQLAKDKNINIIEVKQGDTIIIEKDVQLKILYPTSQLEFEDLNNNSIVAKLIYTNFSMLFTGDMGIEAENKLIKKYSSVMLKSTVLKVGHHGSKTSSGGDFIKIVNPQIALIGVGKDNTFGHPSKEIIQLLKFQRD